MKPPKMPKMGFTLPTDRAVKAGQAYGGTPFAYHPPSVPKAHEKMDRPHGGHGPKN